MKWEKVEIGKVSKVISGFAFKSKDFQPIGTPIVKIKSIKDENIVLDEGDCVDSAIELPLRFHLSKGDILISLTGSHITLPSSVVGRVARYRHEINSYLNQRAGKFINIDNERCHKDYLFYFLLQKETLTKIANKAQGAANQANISPGDVEGVEINLPPLPTQRKIASILSAYDDLIENNLKRIKLLEEKAFLRYKSEFDFFKPSNEINKIPEGWSVKRADEIFKINIGKTPPREQSEWFNDDDSKVKWVSIKDINNSTVFAFETSETVTEMAVSKFNMNVAKAHTVLLSFKLTVGKVAITTEDMTTNEAIAHFKIEDENQMCSEYIYFYLKNFPYDSLGSTSSIGTAINSKVVKAMPVLLPPKKVINDYKKDVENDFNLIQNLLKQNTKLREARDILLPKLMNQQIGV
ncbi:restriction endonuclease subunit S [Chryseobacterium sp. SC28]|uniref:restriction endonuclease subunit S n=1 Tax=Chryseobacterium sp. SC28 TaxID=2268028 RepID=UPI000F6514FC|nr:restriction endonuclease subunit S [Chryseobacterium sp. SC28]RRQ46869.1 restriction endonuclease subunit S [Chryseobacterium sp. SC28]